MGVGVNRFDVYLVPLDPAKGSEIQKTRPCVVVSPDELNRHLRTVIVAPMTTQRHAYPSRVNCTFQGKPGQVALDQIRTVDKSRLLKNLGTVDTLTGRKVLDVLAKLFAP